ncbi:MAG: hypothetical protein GXY34_04360 [Syntrophomonadaceae bacterium]|nr:hypothetical protein [Syntrophomonadaceae bacterium]
MLELRINRQPAMIGLNITKAQVDLQTTAGQVNMETTPAKLDIHSPAPVLHIDQRQCFADKGMKSIDRFMSDWVAEAHSDFVTGLSRTASEGDQLARFRSCSIADIVNSDSGQMPDFVLKSVPQQPPEIWCEVYPVQFNNQAGEVHFDYIPARVEANSQPGQVETYLLQKPFLEINWVGKNIDTRA